MKRMYKYLLLSSLCVFGNCFPTIVETGAGFGGYGGGLGGDESGGWQAVLSRGGGGGGHDLGGASSSYGGFDGYGGGEGEGSIGGDYHHGVSIVSTGGADHKGKIFDLTEHGGGGHQGSFGGSFVASSKYSAGGHGGGDSYGVSEGGISADNYSDVLGASEQGRGGHGGYEPLSSEGLSSFSSFNGYH